MAVFLKTAVSVKRVICTFPVRTHLMPNSGSGTLWLRSNIPLSLSQNLTSQSAKWPLNVTAPEALTLLAVKKGLLTAGPRRGPGADQF